MVDDEVSEITQVDHDPEITAESVAQFMKSVNRIRFNSLTATNNVEQLLGEKKFTHRLRSRSCPQLPKLVSPELVEEHETLSRSISSTFKGTFQPTEENLEEEEPDTENVMVSFTKEETPLYNSASKTQTVGCDTAVTKSQTSVVPSSFIYPPVSSAVDKHEQSESNQVLDLLKTLMLPTLSHVCRKCRNEIQSDKQGNDHLTGLLYM